MPEDADDGLKKCRFCGKRVPPEDIGPRDGQDACPSCRGNVEPHPGAAAAPTTEAPPESESPKAQAEGNEDAGADAPLEAGKEVVVDEPGNPDDEPTGSPIN